MKNPFSHLLITLRKAAKFTNCELGRRANVPASLIAGLQSGKRRIGELQARRVGAALGLSGPELEEFVLCAIDSCKEKILNEARPYPAELLNLLARQLHKAGIRAQDIRSTIVSGDQHEQTITLCLRHGQSASLKTQLTTA